MTTKTLSAKVSEKGALSIYGLRRLPITLYADEWEVILAAKPKIEAFIKANRKQLSSKPDNGGGPSGATAL